MVEVEGAGRFRCGDEAVDGLGFSGEGVGGRTRPGGGQGDGACGVGVGSVEAGAPPVGRGVVVADEPRVLVQVHALLVWHSVVGGDGVRGAVAPVPLVTSGSESDGNVVSQQVDRVGLCGVGGCHDRGNVLVRERHLRRPLMQTRTISVNERGCG